MSELVSEVLIRWEGRIREVSGGVLRCTFRDPDGVEPEWEGQGITLDEVSECDRELVVPNAVFDLVVARETTKYGDRRRVSYIEFRKSEGVSHGT